MLPLAHIYISTQVSGKKNSLLVIGSLIPDISAGAQKTIDRQKIHYSPNEFYNFVKSNFPNLLDLALGVKLHSLSSKGADYYSDNLESGFAIVQGKKIATEAGNLWNVKDKHECVLIAHNFIEVGVDLNLLSSNPEILDLYKQSLKEADFDQINNCLSKYLEVDQEVVKNAVNNLFTILAPDNYISKEEIVKKAIIPYRERIFGIKADFNQTLEVLNMAIEITKDIYKDYLDTTVKKMEKDFSAFVL